MSSQAVILSCTCGTYWTRAAVDEFNGGSVERAAERHLAMVRFDSTPHRLAPPASPAVTHTGENV